MVRCRGLDLQAALEHCSPQEVAQAAIQRVTTSDVSDVMVGGEFSVRDGIVLPYSEEDIVRDIRELLSAPKNPPRVTAEPEKAPSDMSANENPDVDLHEEGFRIIRRTENETSTATILPLDPKRDPDKEPSKIVRRVFGEDDL